MLMGKNLDVCLGRSNTGTINQPPVHPPLVNERPCVRTYGDALNSNLVSLCGPLLGARIDMNQPHDDYNNDYSRSIHPPPPPPLTPRLDIISPWPRLTLKDARTKQGLELVNLFTLMPLVKGRTTATTTTTTTTLIGFKASPFFFFLSNEGRSDFLEILNSKYVILD